MPFQVVRQHRGAASGLSSTLRPRLSAGRLLALVGIAVAFSGCSEGQAPAKTEAPRPVAAFQVGLAESLGQRQFTGLASVEQEAVLSFRVPGRILSLPVKVGTIVKSGETIAALDSEPYRADVAKLQADLAAAQALLQQKNDQYDRVMPLVKNGTYPKSRGDDARNDRDGAAAHVASVQSALDRATIDLNSTILTAPFAGRVVTVYPQAFEDVRAQQQIARLVDLKAIQADINIPETLISLVPLVETIEGRFDAFPNVTLVGRIVEVGAAASPVTRTYPVTIAMDQPEGITILPGMAGHFRVKSVKSGETVKTMVVPTAAVRPLVPGKSEMAVWVVDPATRKVTLRGVSLGAVVQGGVEIIKGLSPGEWVVTAGANSLTEGEEVRLPVKEAAAS